MTTSRLIQAAQAAAELFRDVDTPDHYEIRELVRAVDAYKRELFRDGDTPDHHEIRELVRAVDAYKADDPSGHEGGCLMCAVRALTEGDPAVTWVPQTPGDSISGVVLRRGMVDTHVGPVPFVDLWQGGTERIRVKAFNLDLQGALARAEIQVGDTPSIRFDGETTHLDKGRMAGRSYRRFTVHVQRGH